VKILATSREGLGVVDQQVVPVPSLDVGAGIDSAAVTLFVERARSVAPHFSISDTSCRGSPHFRDGYRNTAKTLEFDGHIAWAEAMP
jgi:hypothetical protein